MSIYCVLNFDAARQYRLANREVAKALASKAAELEQSPWAKVIQMAIEAIAQSVPVDPDAADAPPALKRYAQLRRHSSWHALEHGALTREWLSHSTSWLASGQVDPQSLKSAIEALDVECQKARATLIPEGIESVDTFFGVVNRLDPTAAELEGENGETVLVPREDLERQGLAVVGEAVSLLREALPGGGSYCVPMPAVLMEESDFDDPLSPWDERNHSGGIIVSQLSKRDAEWLDRELAREPTAKPMAPLPID